MKMSNGAAIQYYMELKWESLMPYLWVLHTGEEMSPVLLSYYIIANLFMLPLVVKRHEHCVLKPRVKNK